MPPSDSNRLTGPASVRPSRVSPKGQVTIPKPVRDALGLEPGSAVEFEVTESGDVVLRKRPDTARSLRGLLSDYAPEAAPSLDEIDAGIGREVGGLDAAGLSGDRSTSEDDA